MTRKDDANKELEWVACDYCGSKVTKVIYDFSLLTINKCKKCGLVYTNPRLTSRSIRERLYDEQYWKAYEKEIERSLIWIQRFCRNWLNRLAYFADQKNQWKLAEIGPGLGLFLAEARKRGHAVYGVDTSEYAINYAKTRFGIDTIRLGTADAIDELDWPQMDIVVMLAAIEHLHDPLGVLRKVNTSLSHRGLLLLSTGVWGCFNQILAGRAWSIIAPEGHLYYFSKRTMRMFLERAGFRVLELETNSALQHADEERLSCQAIQQSICHSSNDSKDGAKVETWR